MLSLFQAEVEGIVTNTLSPAPTSTLSPTPGFSFTPGFGPVPSTSGSTFSPSNWPNFRVMPPVREGVPSQVADPLLYASVTPIPVPTPVPKWEDSAHPCRPDGEFGFLAGALLPEGIGQGGGREGRAAAGGSRSLSPSCRPCYTVCGGGRRASEPLEGVCAAPGAGRERDREAGAAERALPARGSLQHAGSLATTQVATRDHDGRSGKSASQDGPGRLPGGHPGSAGMPRLLVRAPPSAMRPHPRLRGGT